MSPLDFTSFRNAIHQLESGLAESKKFPTNEIIRDGVIQRFEYTHELELKFIKRTLERDHWRLCRPNGVQRRLTCRSRARVY